MGKWAGQNTPSARDGDQANKNGGLVLCAADVQEVFPVTEVSHYL